MARDELGYVVKVNSPMALSRAEKQPLVTDRLRSNWSSGTNPIPALASLKNLLTGDIYASNQ
jgi:hypothetical protein